MDGVLVENIEIPPALAEVMDLTKLTDPVGDGAGPVVKIQINWKAPIGLYSFTAGDAEWLANALRGALGQR